MYAVYDLCYVLCDQVCVISVKKVRLTTEHVDDVAVTSQTDVMVSF